MIEPIEFEPVTLARLDCIPTPAHGNENLFVLVDKKLSYRHFGKLDCFKPDNKTYSEIQICQISEI